MLVKVTDEAKVKLEEILGQDKSDKALRIYVAAFGWGGPSFGMALEEPKDDDLVVSTDGFKFIMEQDFQELYNKFTIDYSSGLLRRGFTVVPDRGGSTC